MAKLTWLDRAIGAVAPARAVDRLKARQQLAGMTARNEYEGATQGRRSFSWKRRTTDANAELTPTTMQLLRGIAHDLVRNNSFASRGVGGIAEAVVGTGITYRVMRDGKLDQAMTDLARLHFDTTACDAEGRHDFYGLQLQAMRAIIESGAVIMRRRWRRKIDGLPVPFCMQLLEPDYINMSLTAPLAGGGYRLAGIDFDPIGRRVAYQLYAGHPGSALPGKLETAPIQAIDVAHCFRADRPEQQHGVTWFSPIIVRLKDFGEYADAQLVKQKVSACYSGFRVGDPEAEAVPTTDSNGVEIELAGNQEMLEPGTITDLPAGTSIEFAEPPSVDGYGDVTRISLQEISAGLGAPYEVITGDLSNVSFISGRLGRLNFKRSVETWQWTMFIPQFCEPAGQWFLDAAAMMGRDVTGCTFEWTTPTFEMMDPASEVPAKVAEIRGGLTSLFEAIRERGRDPDVVLAEIKSANDMLDALGLTLDCDPRMVTQVGNPIVPNADDRIAASARKITIQAQGK